MKLEKLVDDSGTLYAFEIGNVYIRPRKIAQLLKNAEGISDIKLRRMFSDSNDVHAEFKYLGEDFIVWEPYGDSSVFWIGPKHDEVKVNMCALLNVFESYNVPFMIKLFGDLITLNFKSLFQNK